MAFGKVIKLFLLDGSPNKRWICELSNWTGAAYKIPRNMVKESESRDELSSPGIYFLFGYDDDKEKPLIYVGEAENIIKRLKEHIAKKDNWNEVIAFISKDDNLNKAHIKYLEHEFHRIATEAGRYSIDNSNIPTKSTVSEADQAELEEFIYNAKILVNALGHKVFEKISDSNNQTQESQKLYHMKFVNGTAHCIQTTDGFVLLKGSKIHKESASSLDKGIKKKVEQSRAVGEIVDDTLQVDKIFASSSAAAAFAAGYSISGPQAWKSENGETLKSIESKKA